MKCDRIDCQETALRTPEVQALGLSDYADCPVHLAEVAAVHQARADFLREQLRLAGFTSTGVIMRGIATRITPREDVT